MAKSPNKHNRVYAMAQNLHDELPDAIEKGQVSAKDDPKARSKLLCESYEWDKDDTLKIWSFGPENSGANILMDKTSAVQYMSEIRDSCESAWQWATKEGVMCEENMRGVRINVVDCVLHADAIHRGGG